MNLSPKRNAQIREKEEARSRRHSGIRQHRRETPSWMLMRELDTIGSVPVRKTDINPKEEKQPLWKRALKAINPLKFIKRR